MEVSVNGEFVVFINLFMYLFYCMFTSNQKSFPYINQEVLLAKPNQMVNDNRSYWGVKVHSFSSVFPHQGVLGVLESIPTAIG